MPNEETSKLDTENVDVDAETVDEGPELDHECKQRMPN